jgi:hypothetical protein
MDYRIVPLELKRQASKYLFIRTVFRRLSDEVAWLSLFAERLSISSAHKKARFAGGLL